MKKSQNASSSKPSDTDWTIFKSKTRIFTYFVIISAIWILWWISNMTKWQADNYTSYILIFYFFAFIWQIFWRQDRKRIRLEFFDNSIKICDENKEITDVKYSDIKEIIFLKHKLLHMLWFLLLALLSSILLIFLSLMSEDIVILWVAIGLPIFDFLFHTLPILMFRKNCRSISIITKDKTIKLPKIKWEKELKQILDEKKVRYSCWWSII
jgi:hypothetical protein